MSSAVLESEAGSSQTRVRTARAGRDLSRAIRRLPIGRFSLYGLILMSGLAAVWYGHHWWTVGRFIESTDDAYVGGEVTVIAPKVAGFIAEVAVTDNQAVSTGDLLVKIDDRDYRAALAKATAAVTPKRPLSPISTRLAACRNR
jgi:membrane fusion protein (multidrug efflux system)